MPTVSTGFDKLSLLPHLNVLKQSWCVKLYAQCVLACVLHVQHNQSCFNFCATVCTPHWHELYACAIIFLETSVPGCHCFHAGDLLNDSSTNNSLLALWILGTFAQLTTLKYYTGPQSCVLGQVRFERGVIETPELLTDKEFPSYVSFLGQSLDLTSLKVGHLCSPSCSIAVSCLYCNRSCIFIVTLELWQLLLHRASYPTSGADTLALLL